MIIKTLSPVVTVAPTPIVLSPQRAIKGCFPPLEAQCNWGVGGGEIFKHHTFESTTQKHSFQHSKLQRNEQNMLVYLFKNLVYLLNYLAYLFKYEKSNFVYHFSKNFDTWKMQ